MRVSKIVSLSLLALLTTSCGKESRPASNKSEAVASGALQAQAGNWAYLNHMDLGLLSEGHIPTIFSLGRDGVFT